MKQIFTLVAVVGLGVYPLGADDKETKPLLGTWSATLWEDGDMSLKEADGIPLKAIITKDAFAFDATAAGKVVLSGKESDDALKIRESVRRHPAANRLLSGGQAEVTLSWDIVGADLSFKCKGRAD